METCKQEAARYAESHRKYANLMYGHFPKYVTSLGPITRCLEIGSGPGTLTAMVAAANPRLQITAVDISPEMVTIGEDYVREKGLQNRISFNTGDAADENLIKHLGRFDLIYSFYSLHLWEDAERVLRNLLNALTPNGHLYIFDMRRVWWATVLPVHSTDIEAIKGSYSSGEVEALLRRAGLRQFEIRKRFPAFQAVTIKRFD